MIYHITPYQDVDAKKWDLWVNALPGTSYYHTWHWHQFVANFPQVKKILSFAIHDAEGALLAVCPLAVSFLQAQKAHSFSFDGFPCGVPVVANVKPSERRKILDFIFNIVTGHRQTYKCESISLFEHPINSKICGREKANMLGNENSFEFLRYGLLYRVENTSVIDLRLPEATLIANVGKYHYRHIRRGGKKGISVIICNVENNSDKLRDYFDAFQRAHLAAAGRQTRPQATWEAMYRAMADGKASLFIASVNGAFISFLYCGEFLRMAFGWSQANVQEFEDAYSPRHMLEWSAILHFKSRNFAYYEVGERFFGPQPLYIPSEKEISISVFKERYGGFLMPKVIWQGYFNAERLNKEFMNQNTDFLSLKPIVTLPGANVASEDN